MVCDSVWPAMNLLPGPRGRSFWGEQQREEEEVKCSPVMVLTQVLAK